MHTVHDNKMNSMEHKLHMNCHVLMALRGAFMCYSEDWTVRHKNQQKTLTSSKGQWEFSALSSNQELAGHLSAVSCQEVEVKPLPQQDPAQISNQMQLKG